MKNRLRKNAITMLVIAVVAMIMTGCVGKDSGSSKLKDVMYTGECLLMEGVRGEPVVYIVQDSKVYVETREEESEEPVIHLYSMTTDGKQVEELDYKLTEEFDDFMMGKDGSLIYKRNGDEESNSDHTLELVKKDADGKEIGREKISVVADEAQYSADTALKTDADGNILVLEENQLLVFDENLQAIGEFSRETEFLTGLALTKDGQIVCAEQIHKDGRIVDQAQIFDLKEKQWGTIYSLEEESSLSESISIMDGSGEYDFYYKTGTGIYGYDRGKKKSNKVMDFSASNILSEYQDGILPLGDGRYIGKTSTYKTDMGNIGLAIYSKVDPKAISDKKIITFGGITIDDAIKYEAELFNKENKEYQIEFREYVNYEDPYEKMTADIIAGNVPDIIEFSNESIEPYVTKGILEDLTTYFDTDPELDKEDIIPAVWEAMETEGKHYFLSSGFFLRSLIGKTEDVGNSNGWTYEDLEDVLDKKGNGIQLLDVRKQKHLLELLLETGVNDFIDWDKGTCSFDGAEFPNILQISNEYGKQKKDGDSVELFAQGEQLLLEVGVLNIDEFLMWDEIFGDEISYIGYPNEKRMGNYYSFLNRIGMYAHSEVKDGAWEFMRRIMTKEYQGTPRYVNYGELPTRQDCFDLEIEAAMATKEYTNEMEQEITPRSAQQSIDDFEYDVKPMTEKQEKKFRELIDNTRRCEQYDEEVISIIIEEAEPYFAGEKSLEETVNLIQNRVKTYVNENR